MGGESGSVAGFTTDFYHRANIVVVGRSNNVPAHLPAGSDVAVAAVKSAMAAANQAYDAFSKATKQVAEATEATMTAATNTVATKKKAA